MFTKSSFTSGVRVFSIFCLFCKVSWWCLVAMQFRFIMKTDGYLFPGQKVIQNFFKRLSKSLKKCSFPLEYVNLTTNQSTMDPVDSKNSLKLILALYFPRGSFLVHILDHTMFWSSYFHYRSWQMHLNCSIIAAHFSIFNNIRIN